MEQKYWLGRKRASAAAALGAKSSESRLIHLDLAGRYSIKAALAATVRAGAEAPAMLALTQLRSGDAEHYGQLETGARWLASRSSNEAERHEHLAMATRYARLGLDAADGCKR